MTGLLRVPFFADELLTSYLSRMARANGRMEMRLFLADLGLNARGIVRGERDHADKLEEVLGCGRGTLRTHGFAPVDTRHVSTRGMVFLSGTIAPFAARFCPDCLEEDVSDGSRMIGTRMYARVQWTLSCVSACDRHERKLGGIGGPATGLNDLSLLADAPGLALDFCSLADRWHSMKDRQRLPAKPYPPTAFERFVAERLRGCTAHGDLLDGMTLPDCIDACRLVGSASRFGRRFRLRPPGADDRSILAEGFDLMSEGKQAIWTLLDRMVGNRPGSGRSLYGSLSTMLASKSATHSPLKTIIHDHAKSVLTTESQIRVDAGDWTSIGTIASSVALPPRTVARYLLERGEIRAFTATPSKILVPKLVGENAIAVLADVASFDELRKALGCSVAEIRSIAAFGLLKPVFGNIPKGSQAGTDLYLRSAVADLRSRAVRSTRVSLHGLAPLRVATQMTGLQAGEILDLVVRGRLNRVACDAHLPLFDGLRVDCKEIAQEEEGAGTRRISERYAGSEKESEISADVVDDRRYHSGRYGAPATRRLPAARSGTRAEL